MPFGSKVKTEMFIKCGRLCCLCLKQCGTNIEAAHIIDESDGGPNEFDNGIPVCFDCHQEIGAYNKKHPIGNKLQPKELKARRDRIYMLVESGTIYAQVIAERSRISNATAKYPELEANSSQPNPSKEAKQYLQLLLSDEISATTIVTKLSLLNNADQAYVVDSLLSALPSKKNAISLLARIAQSNISSASQVLLILEQSVRSITLLGDASSKAELLKEVPPDSLSSLSEDLRIVFFEDLIAIINHDQYEQVNLICPALIGHQNSVPSSLYGSFVIALLDQAKSVSFKGAPAARQILNNLPENMVRAGLKIIDKEYLSWNMHNKYVTTFIRSNLKYAESDNRKLLKDFTDLSGREFLFKYESD